MTERSRKYMFHIVEELERRGMPSELALLPLWKAPSILKQYLLLKLQEYGSSCQQLENILN